VAASAARGIGVFLCGVAIIAALSLTSTAKAGPLATGAASYCDPSSTKAYSQFGDSANYARLFNGGFENGSTGWALSGGARVVAGNEPYYLSGNRADSHSLSLPAGGSASSGTVCFALGDWHLRFMMKRLSSSGAVRVQVVVPSLLGVLSILDGGTVSGSGSWAPSPRMALLLSNVTSLLGTKAVAFRFTAVNGGSFQIDDVYLDPWKCT
jgi:hypothetical protein